MGQFSHVFAQELKTDYLLGSNQVSADAPAAKSPEEAPSVLLSISPAVADKKDFEGTKLVAQSLKGPMGADEKYGLSDDTYVLAKTWGLLPSIESLKKTPKHYSSEQIEGIVRRLIIRQQIDDMVLTKLFEVRKTLNIIDKQIDTGQAVRAQLSTKRDKAIRFNTYADLVAGGITGMIAGSLRLGTLLFVAPDVVDVVEGVAQTGLASWALRTENIQHRMEKGVPNLLGKIIFPDHNHPNHFPECVWQYLNTVPSSSKTNLTRREEMLQDWTGSKFCLIHRGHRLHPKIRARHASGTHSGEVRLSIELLEDRVAMLQDLRVTVTEMEDHIAEIYNQTRKF